MHHLIRAAALALCGAAAATCAAAAPQVTLLPVEVSLTATAFVGLGTGLGGVSDHDNPSYADVPPGTALLGSMHLDWEKQIDQQPNGDDGGRSQGFVHIDQSVQYTVQSPAVGPWQLATQASFTTSAKWMAQDARGQPVADSVGHIISSIYLDMSVVLVEPATLRLAGQRWVPDNGAAITTSFLTLQDVTPGGDGAHLFSQLLEGGTDAVEYQQGLAAGTYQLRMWTTENNINMACCNIAHASAAGWDLLLELDRVAPVPEPATLGLWLVGLAGLGALHRRRAGRAAGLAACLVLAAGGAAAQGTAALDTRNATVHLTYGGGFATSGKNGTAGAPDPVGLAGPATVGAQGADSFVGSYLGWAVNWQMQWDLQQTWALSADGHTLSGSGFVDLVQSNSVIGPGCAPECPASVAMTARNWQDLQFTLNAPAAYQFHSEVSLKQGVVINRWDDARQRWQLVVFSVPGGVADRAGTLEAGRWQVVNSRTSHVLGSSPNTLDESWNFSLTLADAQWVSAVPEPASALLLLPGLALLGLRRRAAAP